MVTGGNGGFRSVGPDRLACPQGVHHRLQVRLHHEVSGLRGNLAVLAGISSLPQSIIRFVLVLGKQRPECGILFRFCLRLQNSEKKAGKDSFEPWVLALSKLDS